MPRLKPRLMRASATTWRLAKLIASPLVAIAMALAVLVAFFIGFFIVVIQLTNDVLKQGRKK